jgi:hypothetical protein
MGFMLLAVVTAFGGMMLGLHVSGYRKRRSSCCGGGHCEKDAAPPDHDCCGKGKTREAGRRN